MGEFGPVQELYEEFNGDLVLAERLREGLMGWLKGGGNLEGRFMALYRGMF